MRSRTWARVRFTASWAIAVGLVVFVLPRAVSISWHGVLPVLRSVHWPAALALVAIWLLGLYVHSFVLTAAAPTLTHRRALALNVTGSAVANVVPLGGAAGVELNRRMMKTWGIDTRTFTGFTFLTNLWDVGAKLLLPLVGVAALVRAGESVIPQLRTASLMAGIGFALLVATAGTLLSSPRGAVRLGRFLDAAARRSLRLVGRRHHHDLTGAMLEIRRECADLVAQGWLRMSVGIIGYVALQFALLAACVHLTNGGVTWADVLAAFAVERLLTVVPITPGGVGVADLGLVGVLLALGGDPTGVTAAAVLYRVFIFAIEIPVGGGALGVWLWGQRRAERHRARLAVHRSGGPLRVAHVTDVYLPRLGGIETHVDDLIRHQRAQGLDAHVLTPTAGEGNDPAWVRRLSAAKARPLVADYDVIHVHLSMLSVYGVSVARAAMTAGVPTLITVHSMWTGAGGLLRLAALAGVRRWPVAWSAVSAAAAEVFERSIGGIDVAVLPNALDVTAWRPRGAADLPPAAPRGQVTVVSVMRLMPRKRPVQLVRVFARAQRLVPEAEVRLVIVGDGPLRARVERFVARRGLGDRVRVTGRIPRERVLDELSAASIYVAPAPKESFGIAALEARCAGLPILAHRESGIREFVRDRVDGVLVDGDLEMAVAIADLVRDDALRTRIADHNRRVAPPFDWADVLERTHDLYDEAAARATRPSLTDMREPAGRLAAEA